jgi:ankyrin repeat protein
MAVNHLRLFDVPRSVKTMLYQCVTDITKISDAVDSSTGVDSWFQLSLQTLDGFGPAEQSMAAAVSFMRKASLAGHGAAQVLLAHLHEASGAVMDASTRSECEKFLVKGVEKGSLLARIWLRGYDREALREAEQKQAQKVAGVSFGDQVDSRVRIENRIDALFGETAFASMSPRLSAVPELASMWLSSRKNSHLHTGAAFGVSLDRFRPWLALLCRTINASDDDGNTALLLAVRFNHVDIAKLLLENGADASLPNKRGETVWHWLVAVEKLEDTIELVKLLKKTGGSVLDATARPASGPIDIFGISHGGTALHWAVELGMTGLARTLVSCGADIQHSFNGARPVDIAIRRNRFEILRVFLKELRQRGEELGQLPLPFTSDEAGEVSARAWFTNYVAHAIAFHPFHERLVYGGKGWADALRQTLVVLREFGLALKVPISALPQLLQSTGGSTTILRLLAEEDFLDGSSDQAKFWADIAETIIRTSDTTNVLYAIERLRACSPDGRLPNAEKLLDICTESFGCDRAVVDAIAAEDIKMDFPTLQSRTPLTGAVLERNFEIASALIEHGADVNAMWKPIYPGAPDKEHPEVSILYEHLTSNLDMALAPLKFLLEPLHSKEDFIPSFIVVPGEKKTALHLACRSANPLIVDYLLEKFHTPYHLDYVDYGDFTALHYAVFYGHVEVARKLCQKGARVDILAGDESLEPEDRRNALDYCHRLGGPNASDLHDSYGTSRSLEDVHLGRLEISKMLVRVRQAVRTVGSTDLDDMVWSVRLCFYAAQKNMTRLLKAALEELRNDPTCGMSWQEALDELLVDAAISGQAGTTKLLINYGANVNQVRPGDEDLTLLHQVVINQEAESAYQLLRAGAKVNAYDKAGRTPLMYGLRSQDLATCRVLKHFGGMATLDWGSTAQILANNLGIGIEEAMAFLEGENLHMDVKLIGEPSDDDTEDEGQDDVEDEEVDKEEHEGGIDGEDNGADEKGNKDRGGAQDEQGG